MLKYRRAIAALTAIAVSFNLSASRLERSINTAWTFQKEGSNVAGTVNIPHCWNAADCQDEVPGIWKGVAWYRKNVVINDCLDGKRLYIRFEGAYQELELFVNGSSAGSHTGGYTAFVFDITSLVRQGENEFRIRLDNSLNPDIPPLQADFTFFGGIYRDVSLLFVPEDHISVSHYASSGVYVSTPSVGDGSATLRLETHLSLANAHRQLTLLHRIISPSGREVASCSSKLRKLTADDDIVNVQNAVLAGPVLWDIDNPALYSVETSIVDAAGNTLDSVRNSFGVRTFRFDSEKGFFLNGRHVKLIGTNRHQDFKDIGNALPDEMHLRDVRLLKDMGGNFLRIAHYPQDPLVSKACDRLGIVTSVEIPIVDYITTTPEFTRNCVEMAREMVYQSYNNPSMVIWAYMNEVLNRRPWTGKTAVISKEDYFEALCGCATEVERAIKLADPLRYTMIPNSNAPEIYKESGVADIPDILGFNLYCGWYTPGLDSFGPTLAKLHSMFPGKPLILTEYGADEDPRLHSFVPERFDYTCEYGLLYHKSHIPVIMDTDFLAGSNVWNINDFYSEVRGFAVPHVNNKGLTGLDRTPKDTYWLYKAWLDNKPFLRIGGQDWKLRGGVEKNGTCVQTVEVFTNGNSVELRANGTVLGSRTVTDRCASFEVAFVEGENVISARADNGAEDLLRVDFRMVPSSMEDFTELSVSLGDNRYFEDRPGSVVWLPEKEYAPGSWGYVGGNPVRPQTRRGSLPAFEKDILGTDTNPIFQTQRAGLEAFKADVPDGHYCLYLYFAELSIGVESKPLPYSLGNDIIKSEDIAVNRVFDVSVNGVTALKDFNIRKEFGSNRAVIKRFALEINDGGGLTLAFSPGEGLPVLNALRLVRVD